MMQSVRRVFALPSKMRWFEWLWLGLPVAVWFSYQPVLRLGQNETMYFELSIAVVYLAIVAAMSVPLLWQQRRALVARKAVWLSGAFVLWSLITLLWTPNALRGALTCLIAGGLLVVFWGMLARGDALRRMAPSIARVFIGMTVVMSGVAIVQFFAGIWLDQTTTLLCAGCQAVQFGFVRPNGFTIEPQFFGGLLVLGILLLAQGLLKNPARWYVWAALLCVMAVLVLTLSRGAILSLLIAGVIITTIYWRQWRTVIKIVGTGVVSIALALVLQGWAAAHHPVIEETFGGAIQKSVHQLTMGTVRLEIPAEMPPEQSTKPSEANVPSSDTDTALDKTTPVFDGYVEESTNIRLALSELALSTWSRDMPTRLFGVGTGGAGIAMHQMYPERIGSREIVQNEYIETLLEGGIVKLGLSMALLVSLAVITRKQPWYWAVLAACMVQWLFFSGYPNALHAYLALIVMAALHLSSSVQTPFAKS